MWQLSRPTIKTASFNWPADDQGGNNVAQLWQDDVCLINALSQVNWKDADANYQFEVCQGCGYVGCAPGGWVSLRRMGAVCILLTAFQKIELAAKGLSDEYLPPRYLSQNGSGWIEEQFYRERLCGLISCPDFAQLPALSSWEAAKLIQWEAPHQILGDIHSTPKLLADLVIASSEESFLEQVPIFSALMAQLLEANKTVTIRAVKPQEQMISFYLDLAGIPQWQALVYDSKSYQLYLEPGYVIVES